jgi:hypothetical protein
MSYNSVKDVRDEKTKGVNEKIALFARPLKKVKAHRKKFTNHIFKKNQITNNSTFLDL